MSNFILLTLKKKNSWTQGSWIFLISLGRGRGRGAMMKI
jgi:hypothetical protein